jgi:hypothetical protein
MQRSLSHRKDPFRMRLNADPLKLVRRNIPHPPFLLRGI